MPARFAVSSAATISWSSEARLRRCRAPDASFAVATRMTGARFPSGGANAGVSSVGATASMSLLAGEVGDDTLARGEGGVYKAVQRCGG